MVTQEQLNLLTEDETCVFYYILNHIPAERPSLYEIWEVKSLKKEAIAQKFQTAESLIKDEFKDMLMKIWEKIKD